ncbi:DUF4115 domain-containing protein [Pontixanthobacter aestiaquae]|uniref:DUF4115 domain-containing protein n=1 Tax=Pontixanthobacter aestiaquae TaxID=1509367 RepID=A0A844Z5Q7_9SPHN|nr:helix-turn-helix domain-containing protein [Pontixanthobacter aestiaquae]MDN3646184.1 DUF4115 domain-containing protein [Pontixanthobacter aestiaquae]MXO82824.1 DUF4115 domain-containing protein [Pontixanthobacter aestiaquae]
MNEEGNQLEGELPLEGAGQRLARARADADKTVEQIASETRIPIRHLETLESGDFAALPAKTYAIGFARTYARVVGLDEHEIAQQVRDELDNGEGGEAHRGATFEPGDPARLPSRGLAWFSAFAVLILIAGSLAYFRDYFMPGSGPGPLVSEEEVAAAQTSGEDTVNTDGAAGTDAAPSGPVVFTSLENDVWVRFYDSSGQRLMEKIMTQGESYTVPADAVGPQIRTGRPEALVIRIGGKSIGTLSNRSETVGDLPVTAEALVARVNDLEAQATANSPDEQTTG